MDRCRLRLLLQGVGAALVSLNLLMFTRPAETLLEMPLKVESVTYWGWTKGQETIVVRDISLINGADHLFDQRLADAAAKQ